MLGADIKNKYLDNYKNNLILFKLQIKDKRYKFILLKDKNTLYK